MGSTRSVLATLGLLSLWLVSFPRLHCSGTRLLYREQALSCMHFPGLSHSGSRFRLSTKVQTRLGLCFVPSPVGAAQAARSLTSALSLGTVGLIPSAVPTCFCVRWSGVPCVSSGELVSSREPSGGCQPSRVSGSLWLEAGSLFAVCQGMLSLGPSLPLSPMPLPPASCLRRGDGPVRSRLALLWYSLSPLLWEGAGSA